MNTDFASILEPGQQVGPYTVDSVIGRGGHGVVYRAVHRDHPGVKVALKVVENRGNLDKLLIEPGLLSQLQHPHIIRLLDYFLHEDRVVLALELVDGVDLGTYLRQHGRLTPGEVREFLGQVGDALRCAHERNILHRDIKPSNILVDQQDGRLRFVLTDFGIGRIAQGIQIQRRLGGTYHFMAPEQLRGRPVTQSDLWAVGVVAYTLLSGELPFAGETLDEVTRQVLYRTPPPPSAGAAPELDQVIFQLLGKQVEGRTASADDLLQQIGRTATLVPARAAQVPQQTTSEEVSRRVMARATRRLVLCLLPTTLVRGVLGPLLLYSGLYMLVGGRADGRRAPRLAGGLALFLTGLVVQEWALDHIVAWMISLGGLVLRGYLWIPNTVLNLCFAPLAAYYLIIARRLRRDLLLQRTLRESDGHPEQIIRALSEFTRIHPGDLAVRQQYTEALLAAGAVKQAAVEARLMLRVDPYNIGANLLLAHAYAELGLMQSSIAICDAYLSVAGYCFEFSDMKERCQAVLRGLS